MSDELNTPLEVDALPADSVIADSDGFAFQVQDKMIAGHVCLRGIQGMGFGTSDMSLSYPVTILRLAGGGRLGEDRTESALASERAARTAAEATIAQVRAWWRYFFKEGPLTPKLKHILDAAPSAALDAHDAQVKADTFDEAFEMMRHHVGYRNSIELKNRAAEIRKAAQ